MASGVYSLRNRVIWPAPILAQATLVVVALLSPPSEKTQEPLTVESIARKLRRRVGRAQLDSGYQKKMPRDAMSIPVATVT